MGAISRAFDNAIRVSVTRAMPGIEVDGFVEIEVTFRFSPRQTRIKYIYAKDCAVCESEEARIGHGGVTLQSRPRLSDIHLQRLDLNYVVPAMNKAASGKLSFKFWIRPPKDAAEVEFFAWTDHIIPPPPIVLLLKPSSMAHGR